jgi:hypothetical protein
MDTVDDVAQTLADAESTELGGTIVEALEFPFGAQNSILLVVAFGAFLRSFTFQLKTIAHHFDALKLTILLF